MFRLGTQVWPMLHEWYLTLGKWYHFYVYLYSDVLTCTVIVELEIIILFMW